MAVQLPRVSFTDLTNEESDLCHDGVQQQRYLQTREVRRVPEEGWRHL